MSEFREFENPWSADTSEWFNEEKDKWFAGGEFNEWLDYDTFGDNSETETNGRVLIEFEMKKEDYRRGIFGFDYMRSNYLKIVKKEFLNILKSQYRILKINNKEYFVPWISLKEGQTIVFNINTKLTKEFKNESIVIDNNMNFSFSPSIINGQTKKLAITCLNAFNETQEINFNIKDKVAGALNFYRNNSIKIVNVRWVFVKLRSSEQLKRNITFDSLSFDFQKAFKSALIDINFVNDSVDILDLTNLDLTNPEIFSNYQKLKETFLNENFIDLIYDKRDDFINSIKFFDKTDHSFNEVINIFFTNCKQILNQGEVTGDVNGFARPENNYVFMMTGNSNYIGGSEVVHEVMHCLNLHHSFNDKKSMVVFNKGATDNYMDYTNARFSTWKWQWDILRASKYAK